MPAPSPTPYLRESAYPQRYRDQRFATAYGPRTDRRERAALAALLGAVPVGDWPAPEEPAETAQWLDMPSGTGRFADALPRPVVQVDVQLAMVAASPVAGPRACASGLALPFVDGAFAGALCMRLFQHLPAAAERQCILRELRRVTRGPLVVSYFDSRSVQHLRRVVRRLTGKPRSGRCAYPWPVFRCELIAAGWQPLRRRPLRRMWSEQVLVLAR